MIERVESGVKGLDELIGGGFLKGHAALLAGSTGSGKTIFSTQFIFNGVTQFGEKGVYATFEEDAETLKDNMLELGFDLERLEDEKMIRVIDLEAMKGEGLSANVGFILDALRDLGAERLVIDSLTALVAACQERFEYRVLMHLLYKMLKKLGCTAIMTCSIPIGSSNLGLKIEEFVADSVIILENFVEGKELKTRLLIHKMRGTKHSRKYHDVVIGEGGLKIIPISVT